MKSKSGAEKRYYHHRRGMARNRARSVALRTPASGMTRNRLARKAALIREEVSPKMLADDGEHGDRLLQ